MPGDLVSAECPCGFERVLALGTNFFDGRWVDLLIAYDADESDLKAERADIVELQKLRTIPDPFASDKIQGPLDVAAIVRYMSEPHPLEEPQGPYLCPQCKAVSLKLHAAGNWD
jgi:hypothetical protein